MKHSIHERAQEYAQKSYSHFLRQEICDSGDVVYFAISPEFSGCVAQGDTPEEAITALRQVRLDCIEHLLNFNIEVPEPQITFTGFAPSNPCKMHEVITLDFKNDTGIFDQEVTQDEYLIVDLAKT